MANFTDLLGTLIKAGMSQSSVDRTTSALGGRDGLGALTDLLGQVMGGGSWQSTAGGGLGEGVGRDRGRDGSRFVCELVGAAQRK